MVLLDRALRLYVAYLLAGVLLFACIAAVATVLPDGIAAFGGALLAVLVVFAGLAWVSFGR